MPKFSVASPNDATTTGQTTTISAHADGAGERGEAVEAIMTGTGIAAAADIQHTAGLIGSDGTVQASGGTAETPEPFNAASAASGMACQSAPTVEPTVVAANDWVTFGFNQRGGMRWAVPVGEGTVWGNDTAEDTLNLRVISSAVGAVDASVHWWEA